MNPLYVPEEVMLKTSAALSTTVPEAGREPIAMIWSVPPEIVVVPVYVLVPLRVTVPEPCCVNTPEPVMGLAIL